MNKSTLFAHLAGAVGASFLIYQLIGSKVYCLPSTVHEPRIMLLGDSLTGTESYCATVLKTVLEKHPGAQVYCHSYPGKGIAYIRDAGLRQLAEHHTDVVVFLAGVNDLASGRGVGYVTSELDKTYRAFAAKNIPIVGITLTPWSKHAKGKHLRKETAQVNAFIYNHSALCSVADSTRLRGQGADGLHLTRSGGRKLAKIVIKTTIGVL